MTETNTDLRERAVLPVLIPLLAIVLTEIIVFSMSRVLLAVDKNMSVVAVVDAKDKKVIAAEEVPVAFQLSDDERREAEALASSDARVIEKLRGRNMNPLTRLYFPRKATSDARRHRYAIVFLRPNDHERYYAIVDLSANEVVDVLTRDALTGQ